MFDNTCKLGKYSKVTNDIGDTIKTLVFREVFCDEKSVRGSEFYQAQAVGIKPEIVLEVKQIDYENEKYVEYDSIQYTVLRTYKVKNEGIELTLTRGINVST